MPTQLSEKVDTIMIAKVLQTIEKKTGKIKFSSSEEMVSVGGNTTLQFVFSPIKDDFKFSGSLELILFPRFSTNAWSSPQTTDPTTLGFVTASTNGQAKTHISIERIPDVYKPHEITIQIVRVNIVGYDLKKGEQLTVNYGDKSGGGSGTCVPPLVRKYYFPIFIRNMGAEKFRDIFAKMESKTVSTVCDRADFLCSVNVCPKKGEKLKVVVPSLIPNSNDV